MHLSAPPLSNPEKTGHVQYGPVYLPSFTYHNRHHLLFLPFAHLQSLIARKNSKLPWDIDSSCVMVLNTAYTNGLIGANAKTDGWWKV